MSRDRDRKPVPQQSVNPVFQIPPIPPQHSGLSQHAHTEWRTVDDNELAADFDGSLSGLGMDLAGIPYNMSDALLALPVFNNCHIGFQYVLSAPTSPATKMNEETLTYLNQGQPYELKIKKIGNAHQQGSKYYKSFIKVFFHERRLQFMEREQLGSWIVQRPGERILDIDSPLSYGILDYRIEPLQLNLIEFLWESTKECGIFIKVNCISTEFTPKKHGGEKGVPFRIQIDTYSYNEDEPSKLLNCASCQIKVFKPKGADRKHKTDRDKVDKLPHTEKEKYQPSYDCTVLTEVPLDNAIANQKTAPLTVKPAATTPTHTNSTKMESMPSNISVTSPMTSPMNGFTAQHSNATNDSTTSTTLHHTNSYDNVASVASSDDAASPITVRQLTKDSSEADVVAWLKNNRFGNYLKFFANYTGADLLTLTRDELVQICGLADGIRLNNVLQLKQIRPRLTIYVNIQSESVFHALYLNAATCQELIEKLANLFNASPSVIVDVHLLGVNKIHILVTDDVVGNMTDGAQYTVEVLKNENAEQYRVLLSRIDSQ